VVRVHRADYTHRRGLVRDAAELENHGDPNPIFADPRARGYRATIEFSEIP